MKKHPFYDGLKFGTLSVFGALLMVSVPHTAAAQITVNFTQGSALMSDVQNALIVADFQAAADAWTTRFTNKFNFNLTIDFADLGSTGVIGSTSSTQADYSYFSYYNALNANTTKSADDIQALSSLPVPASSASTYKRLINYTKDDPNGSGSTTAYTDSSQSVVYLSNANAKAVGLLSATGTATDAAITFNSQFRTTFDFDPSNGIGTNQLDFVSVATHEIGHALGFISGVDILDINSSGTFFNANQFVHTSGLDLFRYSLASAVLGEIDWTAGTTDKYFSLDKGATSLGSFSTGKTHGDGRQASHWKDDNTPNNASGLSAGYIGIMDPTLPSRIHPTITETDLRAFDTIGYNRITAAAAPEPVSLSFAGLGMPFVLRRRHKRRTGDAAV